jgi:hypothetical protein
MFATFLLLNNQQLALWRQHIADGDWLSEAALHRGLKKPPLQLVRRMKSYALVDLAATCE